ncbi:MAG: TetR/AcrR family transcriptional regulator [Chitinophagales bacterium]
MSDKRTDIINATLKVTNEFGFAGTSTDMIAKVANVGKGTIYKYFKSKEVLYSTLFDELTNKFMAFIVNHFQFNLDIQTNFRNIVYALVHYYIANPQEFRYLERYSDVSLNIDQRMDESTKLIEPIKKMMDELDHGFKFKQLPPLAIFAMTYGPLVAIVNLTLMGKIDLTDELIYEIADSCWESILVK